MRIDRFMWGETVGRNEGEKMAQRTGSRRRAWALVALVVVLVAGGAAAAVGGRRAQAARPAVVTTVPEWSAHPITDYDSDGVTTVDFINATEGWAGGWKGRLFHTTDGGVTWATSYIPNRALYVDQVQFLDATTGWVLANGSYKKGKYYYTDWRLYRTDDGGATWKWLWTRKAVPVDEFQFISATRGWFAGGNKVYTTANGGKSLTDQHADKKITGISAKLVDLLGLRFSDAQNGWVCGGNSGGFTKPIMLRTTNGGKTWRAVKSGLPKNGVTDVWFDNASTGYALAGGLYKTTNGGNSWRRIRRVSGESYDLVQSFGTQGVRMIGSAQDNAVFTSTDGGATWQVVTPRVVGSDEDSASWSAMSFIDMNTGWIVGNISGAVDAGQDYYMLKTPATIETPVPDEE